MKFENRLSRKTRGTIYFCMIAATLTLLVSMSKNLIGANVMPPTAPVEIQVSEMGDSFARRLPSLAQVDRQPAGLNFYTLRWTVKQMGAVVLKHGLSRLNITNVISVSGMEDIDRQKEGMSEITVNSAITASEKISHDEARIRTYAYLRTISEQGWRATIPRGLARLRGKDMNDYMIKQGKTTTLDPSYLPTMNEWMQYGILTEWQFFLNGAYLTVQMTREPTMIDPNKPGAYLLSTIIQSELGHLRGYLSENEREDWQSLLPVKFEEMRERRATLEAEFRRNGLTIDETYFDPPLPNAK